MFRFSPAKANLESATLISLWSDGHHSAVPEPSTWAMMPIGFEGLGFAFRQSTKQSVVR
jgi:hypothetical protein